MPMKVKNVDRCGMQADLHNGVCSGRLNPFAFTGIAGSDDMSAVMQRMSGRSVFAYGLMWGPCEPSQEKLSFFADFEGF